MISLPIVQTALVPLTLQKNDKVGVLQDYCESHCYNLNT